MTETIPMTAIGFDDDSTTIAKDENTTTVAPWAWKGNKEGQVQLAGVDNVNHPSHYNQGKIEVIDFIQDQKLGFCLGNAIKYVCRAGKKDPAKTVEDLDKAIWYINQFKKELSNE